MRFGKSAIRFTFQGNTRSPSFNQGHLSTISNAPGDTLTQNCPASKLERGQKLGLVQTVQSLDHQCKLRVCLPDKVEWLKVIVQAEKKANTIGDGRMIFLAQRPLRIEPVSKPGFLDCTFVLHFECDGMAVQRD